MVEGGRIGGADFDSRKAVEMVFRSVLYSDERSVDGVVVGDHFTPGSNPAVYVDGELVGYADVDEDGTFSFPLPDSVGAGSPRGSSSPRPRRRRWWRRRG